MAERALAAFATLFDVEDVSVIDASGMGLAEIPSSIKAYPGLQSLNLSSNRPLVNLNALRGCRAIEAVDLSDCVQLSNVRTLSVMPFLKAVDLSRCVALRDVGPMLTSVTPPVVQASRPSTAKAEAGKASPTSPTPPAALAGVPGKAKPSVQFQGLSSEPMSPVSPLSPGAAGKTRASKKVSIGAATDAEDGDTAAATKVAEKENAAVADQKSGAEVEESVRKSLMQDEEILGHPSLAWLCLSGCTRLSSGIEFVPLCQALKYVDLFECTEVEASHCHMASSAPQVEHLVWPNIELLGEFGGAQWSEGKLKAIFGTAAEAVSLKHDSATSKRRGVPLQDLVGLPATAAKQAADRAMKNIGIQLEDLSEKEAKSKFLDVELLEKLAQHKADEKTRKKGLKLVTNLIPEQKIKKVIGPLAFSRWLKDLGLRELPGNLQHSELFALIDSDKDGGISVEDLKKIEPFNLSLDVLDDAIKHLLGRHSNMNDATAADLMGKRKKVTRTRLVECLRIAGVNDSISGRVADALTFIASNRMLAFSDEEQELGSKESLQHALGAFAVVHSLQLLEDYKEAVQRVYEETGKAFADMDQTSEGEVPFQAFKTHAVEILKWDKANQAGTLEVVFKAMDFVGMHALVEKDFVRLNDFSAEKTLDVLEHVGKWMLRFPHELPSKFQRFSLYAEVSERDQRGISRRDFYNSWYDLGSRSASVDGRLVFGILDLDGNGRIFREEMLIFCDAIPRRQKVNALSTLRATLAKKYATLEEAHQECLSGSVTAKKQSEHTGTGGGKRKSMGGFG
eukprot:TRINITY_DN14968_c0_g2_i1.p1 TRINITY_DN14968_c0_g2~~TRINITY_DN14968_c0_g2_i1.p1  ORF type:complete len:847 (-),score=193.30 TRINITY_DN14968_c0_g2_i1:117-2498(-)